MDASKKTLFIGTKFYGHDSAVFIVDPLAKDVFAMSTERMTRYKHDSIPPVAVLEKYLDYKKVDPESIERVVVGYSFSTNIHTLPTDFYNFHKNFRSHFKVKYKKDVDSKLKEFNEYGLFQKIKSLLSSMAGWKLILGLAYNKIVGHPRISIEIMLNKTFSKIFPKAVIDLKFYDHETCHAISSHLTSPFDKELLFSFDGYGDRDFSKVFMADQNNLKILASSPYIEVDIGTTTNPRKIIGSVGIIYSYFTELLGFVSNADEGKVEALAAYGKPIEELLTNLVAIFSIDDKDQLEADASKIEEAFGGGRINKWINNNKKEDVAATVQKFLELSTLKYLTHLKSKYQFKAIALSGGIAANVINNLMIFEEITPNLHIVPAMADDGSAQGAAIMAMQEEGHTYESLAWLRDQVMPYHGTSYNKEAILPILDKFKDLITYEYIGEEWPEKAAELVCNDKIGAIFHSKMEWGPRALGNRSIIASPMRADFRDRINKEIKRRPSFQPFCPSILEEERQRLFESSYSNKHMTCAFVMKKEFQDRLPSATHIDGTARVQFVEEQDNLNYYRLLKRVKELSGFGIVINTSFNKHGRAIVESPEDAVNDFIDTDMDFLMIEGFLVNRI